MLNSSLGRDFWVYMVGQGLSQIGNSIGYLALSWWVLDETGSASAMSSILVPVMLLGFILNPLMAPLGDRFDRKILMLIGDGIKVIIVGGTAALLYLEQMTMPIMIAMYLVATIGTALFMAGSSGVVAQLVKKEQLGTAVSVMEGISATTLLLGGIIGGILVGFVGIKAAYVVDALSFIVSMIVVVLIRANTRPRRETLLEEQECAEVNTFNSKQWCFDLSQGFKAVYRAKVLFWLMVIVSLLNIAVAPLQILMPYIVKQEEQLPAWYLGMLESSVGVGILIGVSTLALIKRVLKPDRICFLGLLFNTLGFFIAGIFQNYWAMLIGVLILFMSINWTNVIVVSQQMAAVPDHFRARVRSVFGLMASAGMPLGVAATGWLIEYWGSYNLMLGMGVMILFCLPVMMMVPDLAGFLREPANNAEEYLMTRYPTAFIEKGESGTVSSFSNGAT